MFRIDHPTRAAALPSPDPVSSQGFFTKGNPATSTPATRVTQDWLNAVQEELAQAIENQGLILDKGDRGQLTKAILRAAGRGTNGNFLINPDFRVWQRFGPSPSAGSVLSTLAFHGPDRWLTQAGAAGDVASVLRTSILYVSEQAPSGAFSALQFNRTASAGGGEALLRHRVENVHTLTGQPAVVAFDARKIAGSLDLNLVAVELVQRFGSGGSADVTTTLTPSAGLLIDGSFRRLIFKGTLPTTIGKTEGSNSCLELRLRFAGAQLFNILLTGFTLARGPEDPGYFVRPLPDEVDLCRRFYEKGHELDSNNHLSTSVGNRDWDEAFWDTDFADYVGTLKRRFTVEKRVVPTVTWYAVDDAGPAAASTITEYDGSGLPTTRAVTSSSPSRSHTGDPQITTPPAIGTMRRFAARWTADAELP